MLEKNSNIKGGLEEKELDVTVDFLLEKNEAIENAIPEFMRFNIVESEVRNAY